MKKYIVLLMSIITILSVSSCESDGETATVSPSASPVTTPSASVGSPSPSPEIISEEPSATPEPVWSWEHDTPESQGMDGDILNAMHSALEPTRINTAVVVRNGVITDEFYREGYDNETLFPLHSCSKSFTSILIGIAIEEGYIDSVDTLISEYFPQLLESETEYHRQITIRHLLTHSSGIEWDEYSSASNFQEWQSSENWIDYIFDRRVVSAPGTRFEYSTGGTHLLAAIIQEATGQSAYEYGLRHMFEPMDMDSVQWGADPQGITDGGNGIVMNVYDAAKFGLLMLNRGEWEGEQLVPADWVDECTGVQFARSARFTSYGYQFWVKTFGKGYDTYFAQGFGGQLIFVVPELELVAVFTSTHWDDTHAPWSYFENYVLAACTAYTE